MQLNYGLSVLSDIPDLPARKRPDCAVGDHRHHLGHLRVDKGIRVLSELNVAPALGWILFVLFMAIPPSCSMR